MGDDDDDGAGDSDAGDSSTAAADDSATVSATAPGEMSSVTADDGVDDGVDSGSGDPSASDTSTGDGGGSSDGADADSGGSDETAGEVMYDPEFVWVADFLRANCVSCHSAGKNGNLLLPGVDITNDEVRIALEGVVATTGLLMVEPGDRMSSQTWLQITNEFGAQFPVEDTDRFGAWIDAGAHYLVE